MDDDEFDFGVEETPDTDIRAPSTYNTAQYEPARGSQQLSSGGGGYRPAGSGGSTYSTQNQFQGATILAPPTTKVPLNNIELELFSEINSVRQNPSNYAFVLEKERKPCYRISSTEFELPQDSSRGHPAIVFKSHEGVSACNEAIEVLRRLGPNPIGSGKLIFDEGMSLAAKTCVLETGRTGAVDGGISSTDKLQKFGFNDGEALELTGFGGRSGREFVIQWLIGDGDPERTQRKVLLDPKWKWFGVGGGEHKSVYRSFVVATFADKWKSNQDVMDKFSPMMLNMLYKINEPTFPVTT